MHGGGRGRRGLLPFGHGRRKKKEEPPQEEEAPYYGLHLKSREEYKREYEQTMSFDTVPKSEDEESPYAYLFRDDGGEEHDDGLDEKVRRMREEGITLPVVAIGGIGFDDITQIMSTGVNGIALSGSVLRAEDPASEMRRILAL